MKNLKWAAAFLFLVTLLGQLASAAQSVSPVNAGQVNVTDGFGGYVLMPYIGGGGGGGTATEVQVNGVDTTTQSPINFKDSSTITWSNPSAGIIQANTVNNGTVTSINNQGGPVITFVPAAGDPYIKVTNPSANTIAISCQGCLGGSLTNNQIPVANTTMGGLEDSLVTEDGTTLTVLDPNGVAIQGVGPGHMKLVANTGNIPALPSNTAGFAGPTSGGTSYLIKLPPSVTAAGIPHLAAPGTTDGVNETAMTSSLITAPTDLSATGSPSSSTCLYGDNSWKSCGGGGTNPLGGGTNNQTGTSYTILATDATKLVYFSSSSSVAVTLPVATTSGFTSGFVYHLKNQGAGNVTITPTTSTIDGLATAVLAPGDGMELWSDGSNYFTTQQSGESAVPTCAVVTAGAGTGASCVMATWSTNRSGQIQVTSGSSGSGTNQSIVTLTFANSGFKHAEFCQYTAASPRALLDHILLNGTAVTTSATFVTTDLALTASVLEYLNYFCP